MHSWQTVRMAALLLVVAMTATLGASQPAHAATTRGWTGAISQNWNTAGNWNPAGVPVNGDSVVIAAEGAHITGVPSGLRLDVLYLGATVELSGTQLKISSAISVTKPQAVATLDLVVVLTANVQVFVPPDTTLRLRRRVSPLGTVALDTAGHTLTKANGGDVEVSGDVIGGGTLAATGGWLSVLFPLTFGGTIAMGPDTNLSLSRRGTSPVLCGSALGARVVLTSAEIGAGCAGSTSGVGSLSGTGGLYTTDRFSIAVSGETFEGDLYGPASAEIRCCGQGVQTLRGNSPFMSGSIVVTGGSLVLEGATFPAVSTFSAQGQGAFPAGLGGYGTFGKSYLATAILDLASVDGRFGLAQFPFLQLAPDVDVEFEIGGPTPGTGFTQVVMTGSLTLDSARLNVSFNGYTPSAGQSFTLFKGATALFGTFKNAANGQNLPEGATFTAGGMQFKITYVGGAGHDVIITRQGGASTPTPAPSPQLQNKRILPALARDN